MRRLGVGLLAITVLVGACGGDDDGGSADAPATTTTEGSPAEPFVVLVSNDDGVQAEGIDLLVEALRARDDVDEVVVVAPLENQSGSGDATTEGAVASESETRSGFPAVAVAGEPADAVNHGLDVVLADDQPELVVSGVNAGQNLGPIVDASGTVGAARTAARRGIPAVAVSQGLPTAGGQPDYEVAVAATMAWLDEHRTALVEGTVANINAPTYAAGEIRGTLEVPTAASAPSGELLATGVDCTVTTTGADDVAAFNAGYVVVSDPGLE